MKKWKEFLKLNNRGSSMALALVAIIFVTLLASTVMAVSVANLSLKRTETSSKKAFYTAETAVDELYNALGKQALNSMNDAYVEQLADLVQSNGSLMSNAEANKAMKFKFVKDVLYAITTDLKPAEGTIAESPVTLDNSGIYASTVNKQSVVHWLSSQIDDTSLMDVTSIGYVRAYATEDSTSGYYVEISDVVINYKDEDGYYADITTDFRVTYPDISIVFNNSKHEEFLDYCLIADGNISFGSATTIDSDGKTVTGTVVSSNVTAGMYAGGSINVNHGSTVSFDGLTTTDVTTGTTTTTLPQIVAHDGINVVSADQSATLSIGYAKVWSNGDVKLKGESGSEKGATLNTSGDTQLYVKDDLELNQQYSVANIYGSYYGYGFSIDATQQNASMIINKKNCTLNVQPSVLKLLGHAYIEVGTGGGYQTGESASAKNLQEIYMVLDKYLNNVSNPVSQKNLEDKGLTADEIALINKDTALTDAEKATVKEAICKIITYEYSEESKTKKYILTTDFFAGALLDPDRPITLEYDTSKTAYYIYYNFANSYGLVEDSASVNMELYANAVFTGTLGTTDVTSDSTYKQERKILIKNIRKTFSSDANGGSITMPAAGGDIQVLGPYVTSLNYATAATLAASDAAAIPSSEGNLTVQDAYADSNSIATTLDTEYGLLANKDAFDSIINVSLAKNVANDKNSEQYSTSYVYSGEGADKSVYKYLEKDGTYTEYKLLVITEDSAQLGDIENGIIIHTGTGILTVNNNFKGLIVSNGTVNVLSKSGSTGETVQIITSDHNTISTILENTPDFAKFFSAYYTPTADDGSSISSLDYDDFVSLRNWRKFDDTKESTTAATEATS